MAKKVKRYTKYPLKKINHKSQNISTNAYIWGSGDIKVIVFLPIPHSGLLITKLLNNDLLDKVTLISFDIPGWNNSQKTCSIMDIIDFTKSLLKYLKIKRYSIIGLQFGARLAITLASVEENLNSIVLVNPVLKKSLLSDIQKILIKLLNISISKEFVKTIILFNYYLQKKSFESGIPDSSVLDNYIQLIKNGNAKAMAMSLYGYLNADLSLHLSSLEQQKLLVLNEMRYVKQIEYLKKTIGREKVDNYVIKKVKYPFMTDDKSKELISKFLVG